VSVPDKGESDPSKSIQPIQTSIITHEPADEVDQGATMPMRPLVRGAALTRVESEYRMSIGVLTDPRSLAEYENAIPGAGKGILEKFYEQTAKEQQHRHEMTDRSLKHQCDIEQRQMRQGDRGQLFGLIVALAGFVLVEHYPEFGNGTKRRGRLCYYPAQFGCSEHRHCWTSFGVLRIELEGCWLQRSDAHVVRLPCP
jgi:hypothetical protein